MIIAQLAIGLHGVVQVIAGGQEAVETLQLRHERRRIGRGVVAQLPMRAGGGAGARAQAGAARHGRQTAGHILWLDVENACGVGEADAVLGDVAEGRRRLEVGPGAERAALIERSRAFEDRSSKERTPVAGRRIGPLC
ncbi:hypothetical protein D3C80_1163590 [compost metagenome]